MSPINVGSDYWKIITNRPDEVRHRERREIDDDRLLFAYREAMHEQFGGRRTQELHGQEFEARMAYFIPTLTETPVDRWMERIRYG
jgi:hypothetical protein